MLLIMYLDFCLNDIYRCGTCDFTRNSLTRFPIMKTFFTEHSAMGGTKIILDFFLHLNFKKVVFE